ncbi:MAG: GNAT family N-acetyltransferase [Tenuifilum sp.]|jgi:GNAT superfamily N-acetyltransferase|uniref:GNAT family N-acetyltransferase n=1 Tax=Tenuifilum sp. TaxID=2760880 RepID=UPI002BF01622|nr:GNAT family N-acetyltransferase [Tenuifilum sp.]HOK86633.1 GNAT family N-acetyltransferase [Tenuifilum sp.]HOU75406.1 GNAT family N-acetyltransferase [Tenuifilum sp.]HPP90924.1 GNAT family N-acetyltransferase [Tenuifilum sp.]HRU85202.1 GNAT family N-acetyltransferase [Tenuifilum sp.]
MTIEIVKADKTNLIEVLYIIRECSRQLIEKGVKYWNNSLADRFEISTDIESGFIYLIKYNYVPVGTITLRFLPKKESLQLERLAIFPAYQKKGLGQKLIEFAKETAKEKGVKKILGSIPIDDADLIHLLERNNFVKKGESIPVEMNTIALELELLQ